VRGNIGDTAIRSITESISKTVTAAPRRRRNSPMSETTARNTDSIIAEWPVWAQPLLMRHRYPTVATTEICVPQVVRDYVMQRMAQEADWKRKIFGVQKP
jgi:hypothetical protein